MQLVLDKITPPAAMPRLPRARLLNILHASLRSCVSTIINGRAGTGKTLLAADFARCCGRRFAWYKIDGSEADLGIFLQYFVAAVRAERPGFGFGILDHVGEAVATTDVPSLADAVVYELLESGDEPLLIVLEDLHLIYDAAWVVPFFGRLLPLLPAEAHLLIIGRSLPPAPLWRMRSKQALCVIEEPVINFTASEARRLFESYGLSEEEASAAWSQTRGRAEPLDMIAWLISSSGTVAGGSPIINVEADRNSLIRQVHGYRFDESQLGGASLKDRRRSNSSRQPLPFRTGVS